MILTQTISPDDMYAVKGNIDLLGLKTEVKYDQYENFLM